ncbi:MAG TPA: ABC transporter permease [Terracidiphilus sp.]|nr:ABC transporter permease [Terracidiphilus sp.]
MSTFIQDLRYAARQLRKSPGFTVAAVLTLAIGIGINTAMFSSMDAVVLRPLAVPQMDRVATIAEQREQGGNADYMRAALANYVDWKERSHSFAQMAVLADSDMSLTGAGDAVRVRGAQSSGSFFSVLRAQPLIGRVFTDDECVPGRDGVAVLNYAFWQQRFGSDPGVLGRTIQIDQRAYTIVGVMTKTMQYPSDVDIFVPFAPTPGRLKDRNDHTYLVVGRLRDGVTVEQAQAEMRIVGQQLAKAYPVTNQGWNVRVETLLDGINGPYTPLYYKMLLGATLFVLLVVCANVANLQFARGIARRPEIAMRTALGASRTRIMRQLLTENVLLALLGGAGGVALGGLDLHFMLVNMPPRVARYMSGWSNTSLNGRTLAFSLVLAGLTAIVSGFAPALEALRVNLVAQLKSGTRSAIGSGRSHRLRNIFAGSQIALAVALVIGAALMSKGMNATLHVADGYQPQQVLTYNMTLPLARYGTPEKRAAWYADSLTKLRAIPGVKSAEITSALPYSDMGWVQDAAIENRPVMPGKFQSARRVTVSDGYFSAFHVSIVDGRGFTIGDALGTQPVAVVSRRFVDRYLPNQNPIGQHIRLGRDGPGQTPWLTIVGVAEEATYSLWDQQIQPSVYLSAAQLPNRDARYAVMTDGNATALADPVHKALAGLDAALPVDEMETWQHLMHEQLTGLIYSAVLMGVDALVALLLAAIGIFGVMANLVGERTREIGVRLAMGARREDVLRMIMGRATRLLGVGLGAGLVMAFALARMVANLLRGVSPDDPVVFGSITAAIAMVALAASWIPARRAARVEPMVALRDE